MYRLATVQLALNDRELVKTEVFELSAPFYADAIRRVDRLTLAFALHFPAFEHLGSTRLLEPF